MNENDEYCENCGYLNNEESNQPLNIKPGTIIGDKYIVGRSIGSGGFGVTYIGWNRDLERKVVIKEYSRAAAVDRELVCVIVEKAKRISELKIEHGIVKIYDSFEENEKAYIITENFDGETLADFIKREGRITPQKAVEMMMPVIKALESVNKVGIVHGGIDPKSIVILKTGEVKIADFWNVRWECEYVHTDVVLRTSEGYSAEEQYRSRGELGPHTDVYSVGAVLYKLITGETPPDVLERIFLRKRKGNDILKPIHKTVRDVPRNIETAICDAMKLRTEDRTQNMKSLAEQLVTSEPIMRRVRRSILKYFHLKEKGSI